MDIHPIQTVKDLIADAKDDVKIELCKEGAQLLLDHAAAIEERKRQRHEADKNK